MTKFSPSQGVVYTKSLQTGWKPKAKYRAMREEAHQDFRDKFHIICEGDNLPPPVRSANGLSNASPPAARVLGSRGGQQSLSSLDAS